MLGVISIYTSLRNQAVDSQVELALSEDYLINTDHIIEMEDESTLALVITNVKYKFHIYDDRQPYMQFRSGTAIAALVTLSDADFGTEKVALTVYENIQTFDLIDNATTQVWYFDVHSIVWAENDPTDTYARIWVQTGGNKLTPYIVNHTIAQIVSSAGTTTTSTTSTTSTTTEEQAPK